MEEKKTFGRPAQKVKSIDEVTGEEVVYDSISAAARALGKMSAKVPIINVCKGYQPSAYGFRWEYVD